MFLTQLLCVIFTVGGDTTPPVISMFYMNLIDIFSAGQGDNIPPVVSGCPIQGVTVTAPQGSSSASATWTEPTATDNSGGVVTRLSNRSPGQSFSLGNTQITYTFTDPSGNQAFCRFTVTVLSGKIVIHNVYFWVIK